MKICILTQPLHTNYGGLLQAYALQQVLRELGHEVLTEDRRTNRYSPLRRLIRSKVMRRLTLQRPYPSEAEVSRIREYTDRFIAKSIATTVAIESTDKSALAHYGFEGYVVGSDQVWRKEYSEGIENYFLDFAPEESRKVAYAASFGLPQWEYGAAQSRRLSQLAQRFDVISVRERDAVELCRNHLGVDATQVLDPTLLLDREQYLSLAEDDMGCEIRQGGVASYLLDSDEGKEAAVERIATEIGAEVNNLAAAKGAVVPPVAAWLKGLSTARFIVTDSYHGVIFALIFNRPFVAIINGTTGVSRWSFI